jgi:ATP-dependent 26S proteasome regulatory subunit
MFPADIEPAAPLFNATVSQAIVTIIDEWANFDALSEIDIRPSKTCLIYGAPGTGKTRLALWVAHQLDLPVVLVKLDGLVSSFLGTTSRNIGNLFTFANRYRCVLLLDEFDAIVRIPTKPAIDSDRNQPPIPIEASQAFRRKPAGGGGLV